MAGTIPDILARITDTKRASLGEVSARREVLEARAAERTSYRDFRAALTATRPAIIAELKKASPSKGTFTGSFDPAAIAREPQALQERFSRYMQAKYSGATAGHVPVPREIHTAA